MSWFVTSLRENPELAIFLTLAIGFVIGRIRIGSFSLGNVVGTLLAGVLVGQLAIEIDPIVKVVFFDLFLFATGYKVGPQFFRGLRKNAGSQALLTLVLCVTSLVTTVVAAKLMGYDCGTAAGPPGRGLHRVHGHRHRGQHHRPARAARGREDAPAEQHPRRLRGQLPRGHELRGLVPLESRAAAAARRPQGGGPQARGAGGAGSKAEAGTRSAYREWDVRAFRLRRRWPGGASRTSRRPSRRRASSSSASGAARDPRRRARHGPAARRHRGGRGAPAHAAGRGAPFGEEVEDRELLDFPMAALDVVVTRKEVAERAARRDRRGARPRGGAREARPRRRGDPLRAGDGPQPRRPAAARRGRAATSSARARRSATSSGRRARPTWCSWGSASCSAACSAR